MSTKYAIFLYVWHTIFCILYYIYSITKGSDAVSYYLHSLYTLKEFRLGTVAVTHVTSIFSDTLNMSFGGIFLVFNLFGYIGMIAFASALRSTVAENSVKIRRAALFVILMPNLSFWSSAIGKDAISFMGAGLASWAVLNLSARYSAMVVAILAFLFVRPHMAGILLGAFSVSLIMAWHGNPIKKLMLIAIVSPVAVASVVFGLQYAGLGEATGISDVGNYFETRQGHNLDGGSSVDIAGMPIPLRLFTYLFRPLFFDSPSLIGLVASLENLFFLLLFLVFTIHLLKGRSQLSLFPLIFYGIFIIVSLFVLANTSANLGIAMRQKWMFLPMLFILMFSYINKPKRKSGDQ